MNNLRFGIVTDFYGPGAPLEKALPLLARAGIRDVEIPGGQLAPDILNPPSLRLKKHTDRLRALKRLADDLNIRIWQVHGPYGSCDLVSVSEKQRIKNLDVYKSWIDYARELQAGTLIIHPGGRNDLCSSRDIMFIKEKNADSLARLARHSGAGELKLAIENLPGKCMEAPDASSMFGNRIEDLLELLAMVADARLGICIDTGHANIENWDIAAAIRKTGDKLIATHLQENNGVYDMHMLPFSLRPQWSRMNWLEIFGAFNDIAYPYPLIGECANSSGEYPLWLLDKYLKHQKELMDTVLAKL
ncbi:MAG: sugar phosphate isomerase/epimerase family protein [Victivallales bacterium]